MKHILKILTITFLFPFFSCNNRNPSNQSSEHAIGKEVAIETMDTLGTNCQNQFSTEKIIEFGDSIISYFKKNTSWEIKSYETTIDTVNKENYTKITITIRTNKYKTHGLISYDIFTFQSKTEATDFFNDLKTQELILSFGLNKRPNHILVDSNQVFWHHLEHTYGHRIKELTQIFNQTFNFYPQSTNLDSISGFTHCQSENDNVSINKIQGKWNSNTSIQITNNYSDSYYYSAGRYHRIGCFEFLSENDVIIFLKDSISINGDKIPIRATSSIKLPDSRYFWKYCFFEIENKEFNDEFNKKLEKLKISKESLIFYRISLTNHCDISIIQMDNRKTYMIVDNKFYTLTR